MASHSKKMTKKPLEERLKEKLTELEAGSFDSSRIQWPYSLEDRGALRQFEKLSAEFYISLSHISPTRLLGSWFEELGCWTEAVSDSTGAKKAIGQFYEIQDFIGRHDLLNWPEVKEKLSEMKIRLYQTRKEVVRDMEEYLFRDQNTSLNDSERVYFFYKHLRIMKEQTASYRKLIEVWEINDRFRDLVEDQSKFCDYIELLAKNAGIVAENFNEFRSKSAKRLATDKYAYGRILEFAEGQASKITEGGTHILLVKLGLSPGNPNPDVVTAYFLSALVNMGVISKSSTKAYAGQGWYRAQNDVQNDRKTT
jgi:hypothetical protein